MLRFILVASHLLRVSIFFNSDGRFPIVLKHHNLLLRNHRPPAYSYREKKTNLQKDAAVMKDEGEGSDWLHCVIG